MAVKVGQYYSKYMEASEVNFSRVHHNFFTYTSKHYIKQCFVRFSQHWTFGLWSCGLRNHSHLWLPIFQTNLLLYLQGRGWKSSRTL